MANRIINFIKYNNALVFIVLALFLLGSGVFAQTEVGQEMIGDKNVSISGEDNTLLLEVDLDTFDMDFKIGKIEKDERYYYVTFTYLDIVKVNGVWQYEMSEKLRKIPINIEKDLGNFLAEEFLEQFESRLADLRARQSEELEKGKTQRLEITEYDGLIGKTLDLVDTVFPGYDAVKKVELPSPDIEALAILPDNIENSNEPDSLKNIYLDYINELDPDKDDVFGSADNCPDVSNPDQLDSDGDGAGDLCETDESITPPNDNTETIPETPLENEPEIPLETEQELPLDTNNNTSTSDEPVTETDTEADVEIIEINQ